MAPRQILLLGAGHANIQVLHHLAKLKSSALAITLISDVEYTPYSGMIPSYMAGDYTYDQLHFDLKRLCQRLNTKFIHAQVQRIDSVNKKVYTLPGTVFEYDICSVNIGIQSATIATETDSAEGIIYLKPISKLLSQWRELQLEVVKQITVIGGGAAAFEVAVASRRKFPAAKINLITGRTGLLPDRSEKIKDLTRHILTRQQITIFANSAVQKISQHHVEISGGIKLERQYCLVATSAQVSPLFKKSELPVNEEGFVQVDPYLNVHGETHLFASGDCCHFETQPLAKAGVFAVRQGPIVAKNIVALLAGKKVRTRYQPQKNFLSILVTDKHRAVAIYKNFFIHGKLAWTWKDYIDRKFMQSFQ